MPYEMRDGKRVLRDYTPEEIAFVRDNSHRMRLCEIAAHLGVSRTTIANRRVEWAKQGLIYREGWKYGNWTEEEKDALRGYAAHYTPREIARLMNRPESGVICQLERLGIGPRWPLYHRNRLLTSDLKRLFGVNTKRVSDWVTVGALASVGYQENGSGARRAFEVEEVRRFIRECPHLYRVSDMQEGGLKAYARQFEEIPPSLTIQEAKRRTRASDELILEAIHSGEIKATKRIGHKHRWYIDEASLAAWAERTGRYLRKKAAR